MTATPGERSQSARQAAYTRWSTHTRDERAAALAPARAGFDAKLARQVDPDGRMNPQDLADAVERARRAFYVRLARRGNAARRKKRDGAAEHS